ncbi:hypothetical protein C0J52_04139 [Blattella germanica]|nr:hypothetical protein C0J52_04139 [Blattella germanica]
MACQQGQNKTNMRQKRSRSRRRSKQNRKNDDSGSQFFPQPFGDVSQCNWFWKNYYTAFEWKERHQVAYWKSRSIALEYENNLLYQYLQSITFNNTNQVWQAASNGNSKKCDAAQTNTVENQNFSASYGHEKEELEEEEEEDEDEDQEEEYEVSEEMMAFFEQSIRHKLERQKQREAEEKEKETLDSGKSSDSDDPTLPPKSQIGLKRTQEKKLMYGKAAPMIMGMETAMQLSFDRNCDLKQPKLWPNIPLKL